MGYNYLSLPWIPASGTGVSNRFTTKKNEYISPYKCHRKLCPHDVLVTSGLGKKDRMSKSISIGWCKITFQRNDLMTSSNGNIFRFTGPLWGESTGHQWIPSQEPMTRSFSIFFDLRLNKRLRKQSKRWWFETPSPSLCRHCNEMQRHKWAVTSFQHHP